GRSRKKRRRNRHKGGADAPMAASAPPFRLAVLDSPDHGRMEGAARGAFGRSLAVEVGRDPAVDEGVTGSENEAEIDVLDLGDDALVEHEPDLTREAVLHATEDLRFAHGAAARLEHLLCGL